MAIHAQPSPQSFLLQADGFPLQCTQLTAAASTYEPQDALHQIRALDWLQHEIPIATRIDFDRRWENQQPVCEPLLYPGDQHQAIIELKQLLRRYEDWATIHPHDLNDEFDALTRISVLRFQHRHGLLDDGIVGPLTWRQLRCLKTPMRLAMRLVTYHPSEYPHQQAALTWLQAQLSEAVLTEFFLRWQHLEPQEINK